MLGWWKFYEISGRIFWRIFFETEWIFGGGWWVDWACGHVKCLESKQGWVRDKAFYEMDHASCSWPGDWGGNINERVGLWAVWRLHQLSSMAIDLPIMKLNAASLEPQSILKLSWVAWKKFKNCHRWQLNLQFCGLHHCFTLPAAAVVFGISILVSLEEKPSPPDSQSPLWVLIHTTLT